MGAEHVALLRAVQHRDFGITEVVAFVDDEKGVVSPLTLKVLFDFGARTGTMPGYRLINNSDAVIFETDDVTKALPYYRPSRGELKLTLSTPEKNQDPCPKGEAEDILRIYAHRGLTLAFPTYAGASSYGAAVITGSGTIYFGGQYSAPEKRLNIHAEMSAVIAALMEGERVITHLGLVADKFTEGVCTLCGCCRQFIFELSSKFNWNMNIICFAKDTPVKTSHTINDLLPNSWNSKKWA